MSEAPAILPALVGVMSDLPGIGKDAEMTQGQRYKYRSIDAILPELQPLLTKHGVLVVPEVLRREAGTHTVNSGSIWNDTTLEIRWRFYCAKDGSYVDAVTVGIGSDAGDKSANKAMTASWKYALVTTLCINDGDDPDHTSSTEMTAAAPVTQIPRRAEATVTASSQGLAGPIEAAFPGTTEVKQGDITPPQVRAIHAIYNGLKYDHDKQIATTRQITKANVNSHTELSKAQGSLLIEELKKLVP